MQCITKQSMRDTERKRERERERNTLRDIAEKIRRPRSKRCIDHEDMVEGEEEDWQSVGPSLASLLLYLRQFRVNKVLRGVFTPYLITLLTKHLLSGNGREREAVLSILEILMEDRGLCYLIHNSVIADLYEFISGERECHGVSEILRLVGRTVEANLYFTSLSLKSLCVEVLVPLLSKRSNECIRTENKRLILSVIGRRNELAEVIIHKISLSAGRFPYKEMEVAISIAREGVKMGGVCISDIINIVKSALNSLTTCPLRSLTPFSLIPWWLKSLERMETLWSWSSSTRCTACLRRTGGSWTGPCCAESWTLSSTLAKGPLMSLCATTTTGDTGWAETEAKQGRAKELAVLLHHSGLFPPGPLSAWWDSGE